jgi:predicted aspartyl protease
MPSPSTLRRAALVAPIAAALGAACSGPLAPYVASIGAWGKFPPAAPPVVLPIRDPLRRPDLSVEASIAGPAGRREQLWMIVDSGATGVSVPLNVEQELGLRDVGQANVAALGGDGIAERVFVAPGLAVGGLAVSDVLVTASPRQVAVLGQSILRHAPWEVAWDRGTLTLGAAPWDDSPEVYAVPLHGTRFFCDEVEARVDGRPVRMLLDTGALVSTIPDDVGASLGLPARPFHGAGMRGAAGAVPVDRAYVATLELGALIVPGHAFAALKAGAPALLGRDILSRFDFQVLPGRRLLLRRRGDLRGSAAGRIARWP